MKNNEAKMTAAWCTNFFMVYPRNCFLQAKVNVGQFGRCVLWLPQEINRHTGKLMMKYLTHPLGKRYLLLFCLTHFPEMSLISNASRRFWLQTCGQGVTSALYYFITCSIHNGLVYLVKSLGLAGLFRSINKV